MTHLSNNTKLYGNGVIQEKCDTCGAESLKRCQRDSGYGSVRVVAPHKSRIKKAEKRRSEQQ